MLTGKNEIQKWNTAHHGDPADAANALLDGHQMVKHFAGTLLLTELSDGIYLLRQRLDNFS